MPRSTVRSYGHPARRHRRDVSGHRELYIDLHQNPELSLLEVKTAAKLAERMKKLGYAVTTQVGGTGIVALMKNGAGPTLLVRTDMDALPVLEQTGLPYASKVMHEGRGDGRPGAGDARLRPRHAHGLLDRHGDDPRQAQGSVAGHADVHRPAGRGDRRRRREGDAGGRPVHALPANPTIALALHDHDTTPAGTVGYDPGIPRWPTSIRWT